MSLTKKLFAARRLLIMVVALFATISVAQATNMSEEAIAERIKPVGSVYLDGELPDVAAAASEEPTGPRDGETVYNTKCMACHGTGAAGAPLKGNAEQWAARIAQGQAKMLEHALVGFNAMPPKGTCMDCSDDEIQAAIDFMIQGI